MVTPATSFARAGSCRGEALRKRVIVPSDAEGRERARAPATAEGAGRHARRLAVGGDRGGDSRRPPATRDAITGALAVDWPYCQTRALRRDQYCVAASLMSGQPVGSRAMATAVTLLSS